MWAENLLLYQLFPINGSIHPFIDSVSAYGDDYFEFFVTSCAERLIFFVVRRVFKQIEFCLSEMFNRRISTVIKDSDL